MINPGWLKTFCTLVEVGHFTKTSEVLFMTQSGVSQHIKKLEAYFGVDLIFREGKSFSLTEAGQTLYEKGGELLRQGDELENILKQDEKYLGLVRLASPGSVGLKLYPHLLDTQQEHQGLVIDYRFAPNKQIEKDLADRKIDIGLISKVCDDPLLLSEKVTDEPLVLVTPAHIRKVDWSVLMDLGFISHPDGNHHGRMLLAENFSEFQHMQQFQKQGFSNQISFILEPVSRGLGFTVLPLHAVNAFNKPDLIAIHYLSKPVFEPLYCCVNRNALLANRVKYIKSVVQEHLS